MSEKYRRHCENLFSNSVQNQRIPTAYQSTVRRYISRPNEPDAVRTTFYTVEHGVENSSSQIIDLPQRLKSIVNLFQLKNTDIDIDLLEGISDEEDEVHLDNEGNMRLGKEDNESAYFYFNNERAPGYAFPSIEVKSLETRIDTTLSFSENDSRPHLVMFWNSFKIYPNSWSLPRVQKILERNPHWQEKVKMIAINHEPDIQSFETQTYPNIDFYWVDQIVFNSISTELHLNPQPMTFCLVHKGLVLWVGHPADKNWENYINSLLEGIPFNPSIPTPEESKLLDFDHETHMEMMNRGHEKWTQFRLRYNFDIPNLVSIHRFRMEKGFEPISNFQFELFGNVNSDNQHLVEELISELSEIFPYVKNNVEYIEIITINRGNICSLCNSEMDSKMIQYLCTSCEPKYYLCETCHNKKREEDDNSYLHYFYKIEYEYEKFDVICKKDIVVKLNDPDYPRKNDCMGLGQHPCVNEGEESGCWYKCVLCESLNFCETCFKEWNNSSEAFLYQPLTQQFHYNNHTLVERFYHH